MDCRPRPGVFLPALVLCLSAFPCVASYNSHAVGRRHEAIHFLCHPAAVLLVAFIGFAATCLFFKNTTLLGEKQNDNLYIDVLY